MATTNIRGSFRILFKQNKKKKIFTRKKKKRLARNIQIKNLTKLRQAANTVKQEHQYLLDLSSQNDKTFTEQLEHQVNSAMELVKQAHDHYCKE